MRTFENSASPNCGLRCHARLLSDQERSSLNGADVAAENSKALANLIAGQFFIKASDNPIPRDGLEEGMPWSWRDEVSSISTKPDGDDFAS